jgi:hypothetical protein
MLAPHPSVKSRSRWLLPREHGAYAEVLFPLGTASCLGRPSVSSLALSVAVVAAFLAHEPLLVLLGARGGASNALRARELKSRGSSWPP